MNVKERIDRLPLRSLVLLVALLALIFTAPLSSWGWGNNKISELLYLAVFCVAGYLLNSTRKWVMAYLFVAAPAFLVGLINVTVEHPNLTLVRDVLLLALQVVLISAVVKFALLDDDTREIDRIVAGICGYLTLALFWAKLYSICDNYSPGAFRYSSGELASAEDGSLLYFSLVTLTTLGYGDIAPATSWARILSAMQAVAGTLYLAVLIASLMSGLRLQRRESGEGK